MNTNIFEGNFVVGILGGGQLGKMMIDVANRWNIKTFVLDPNPECPSSEICTDFYQGSYKDYETVIDFGKKVDVLTIEIEHVNTEALKYLASLGIKVYPNPDALEIIKDKYLQKLKYKDLGLPTSFFIETETKQLTREFIDSNNLDYPFFIKSKKDGYDGKGVMKISSESDLNDIFDGEIIVEECVEIEKEISVIIARGIDGDIKFYPSVEMIFDEESNLVKFLKCPSSISETVENQCQEIAKNIIQDLDIIGLLAVEFFLDKKGEVLVNEVAPRTHNSGHHTIEANITSQFEQQLRAICGLPLGSTDLVSPAVMYNLVGEHDAKGKVKYEGIENVFNQSGANLHLYGKKEVSSFRKMGHITFMDQDVQKAQKRAEFISNIFKITSYE